MDYPKTVLNVGLVNGKFIDEDNDTGQAGSLIPAVWGNAVTDELLAVIRAGGLEPAEMDHDQLQQAIQAIVRGALAQALPSQSMTAFTTTGTAPKYVLSPLPALNGYVANQRFRVKFGGAGSGATTLDISGKGAKSLKQYDSSGNKVNAVFAAGQLADVEFDGSDMVVLDPLPVPVVAQIGIQGAAKTLSVSASGTNAQVAISAEELTLKSAEGNYKNLANLALSISTDISGINGLDTGILAASTWYSIWVIWNGSTTAGVLSLSATAPVMPSGYTYKARVGWLRTDATALKRPLKFSQRDRRVSYGKDVQIAAGAVTFPTAVSLSGAVPPTAGIVNGRLVGAVLGGITLMVSPVAEWYPVSTNTVQGYSTDTAMFSFALHELTLYWGATSSGLLYVFGWEDTL